MALHEIDKLAWIHIKQNQVLLARSKGKDTYYIPGGKREPGETDQQALIREIQEELDVDLLPETIQYLESFIAPAHDKPEGTQVKITCYRADFQGELNASAEIEKLKWVSYDTEVKCSPVTRMILNWLRQQRS